MPRAFQTTLVTPNDHWNLRILSFATLVTFSVARVTGMGAPNQIKLFEYKCRHTPNHVHRIGIDSASKQRKGGELNRFTYKR